MQVRSNTPAEKRTRIIRLPLTFRRKKKKKVFRGRISPILQVGVKPGQLVAVHQVLGVAEVWQRVSVVAQVGQSVGVVVGTFHHGVQQGVLAVGRGVGPVGSV